MLFEVNYKFIIESFPFTRALAKFIYYRLYHSLLVCLFDCFIVMIIITLEFGFVLRH